MTTACKIIFEGFHITPPRGRKLIIKICNNFIGPFVLGKKFGVECWSDVQLERASPPDQTNLQMPRILRRIYDRSNKHLIISIPNFRVELQPSNKRFFCIFSDATT